MSYDKTSQLSCCHANRPAIGNKVKLRVISGHWGQLWLKNIKLTVNTTSAVNLVEIMKESKENVNIM